MRSIPKDHPQVATDTEEGDCPFLDKNRPDVRLKRPLNLRLRFGIQGLLHAVFGLLSIVLLNIEFARLPFSGFSLDSVPNKYICAGWIISSVATILTTFNFPYYNFIFSDEKKGDPGRPQRRYNRGRGYLALIYPYIAARTMLLPSDIAWLEFLDPWVAAIMLFPFLDVAMVYPQSVGAHSELIYIVNMAMFGASSSILSTEASRAFAYNQSILWTLMSFDGFLVYILYHRGIASVDTLRRKITFLSSFHVICFCIMFWRKGPGALAPIFVMQVMKRHINLCRFSFKLSKSGFSLTMHCLAWILWAVLTQNGQLAAWVFATALEFLIVNLRSKITRRNFVQLKKSLLSHRPQLATPSKTVDGSKAVDGSTTLDEHKPPAAIKTKQLFKSKASSCASAA